MKKSIKVIAIALVVVLLAATLTGCATTISGVYSSEAALGSLIGGKASYNFSGSKVTLTVTNTLLGKQTSEEYKGSYEITKADDDTQSIALSFESADANAYAGTYSFSMDKDAGTITIGGVVYTKQ